MEFKVPEIQPTVRAKLKRSHEESKSITNYNSFIDFLANTENRLKVNEINADEKEQLFDRSCGDYEKVTQQVVMENQSILHSNEHNKAVQSYLKNTLQLNNFERACNIKDTRYIDDSKSSVDERSVAKSSQDRAGLFKIKSNRNYFNGQLIADGHGANGHLIAEYIKVNLPCILQDIMNKLSIDDLSINLPPVEFHQLIIKVLQFSVAQLNTSVATRFSNSGSTLNITLMIGDTLYIANLGDSSHVLVSDSQDAPTVLLSMEQSAQPLTQEVLNLDVVQRYQTRRGNMGIDHFMSVSDPLQNYFGSTRTDKYGGQVQNLGAIGDFNANCLDRMPTVTFIQVPKSKFRLVGATDGSVKTQPDDILNAHKKFQSSEDKQAEALTHQLNASHVDFLMGNVQFNPPLSFITMNSSATDIANHGKKSHEAIFGQGDYDDAAVIISEFYDNTKMLVPGLPNRSCVTPLIPNQVIGSTKKAKFEIDGLSQQGAAEELSKLLDISGATNCPTVANGKVLARLVEIASKHGY